MEKIKVGVIGCGNISSIYLKNLQLFKSVDLVAVSDIDLKRAEAKAGEFNISKFLSPEKLLKDKDIRIIVNLTIPKAHKDVAMAAIRAGKSVYNEKPLAITREDGQKIISAAKKKGVLVGCAPDTFMGAGIQTVRKIIDSGEIGRPVAATAFMMGSGPEGWHPNPEFFYQKGGGPLFDMGPYYITALVNLIGPVKRVTSSAQISFKERIKGSEPRKGKKIKVEVPTHVSGVLDFKSGAVATIIMSFDVKAAGLPCIEVYCEKGTIAVPDPNTFNGPVKVKRSNKSGWEDIALTYGYSDNSRGLGVADMACALISGRKYRASGELAFHVLDVMQSLHEASEKGKHIMLATTCTKPEAMVKGLKAFELER
ncbi:MAG: oxidoreductase [Candidatus Firestonebacteria bacterium RIFOXYC2_FULL_39_67]|nr:MAG: oxidoreductase [Candidatus Firestonebacteria bacterium RIFOXYD2_FULL_39_29]OGF52846.1 MAG: oxidoreductase [Candidatus Firestonebacteria bacterium RifOxyC12_full_39_7]OGF57406.1 MAG: oxidoreductase [Candidatus Firestonebacteria bacterium RIFOXYC2_FULL_39_67]